MRHSAATKRWLDGAGANPLLRVGLIGVVMLMVLVTLWER